MPTRSKQNMEVRIILPLSNAIGKNVVPIILISAFYAVMFVRFTGKMLAKWDLGRASGLIVMIHSLDSDRDGLP